MMMKFRVSRLATSGRRGIAPMAACLLFSVQGGAADLVTERVDAASLVAMPGHRVAWANAANDRGPLPDDQLLAHLTLVLRRSPELQRAFEALLERQQDPRSPDYHWWLTPIEVGERFGASSHDIEAVGSWLESQGLRVDAIANSRTRIAFSGNVAAVAAAFGSSMRAYLVNGERRIALAAPPRNPQRCHR